MPAFRYKRRKSRKLLDNYSLKCVNFIFGNRKSGNSLNTILISFSFSFLFLFYLKRKSQNYFSFISEMRSSPSFPKSNIEQERKEKTSV